MDAVKAIEILEADGMYEEAAREALSLAASSKDPLVVCRHRERAGRNYLLMCKASFDPVIYKKAVLLLMEVYNKGKDEEILALLQMLVYLPNQEALQNCYDANIQFIQKNYKLENFPAYDALPFLLFPLDEQTFISFDRGEKRFLLEGEVSQGMEVYRDLVIMALDEESAPVYVRQLIQRSVTEEAGKILRGLEALCANGDFGADFAAKQARYQELRPDCAACDRLVAERFYAERDFLQAERYARKAHEKCRFNRDICRTLAKCYEKNRKFSEAAGLYSFVLEKEQTACREKILELLAKSKAVSEAALKKTLRSISLHCTSGLFAPFLKRYWLEESTGELLNSLTSNCGRFLPDEDTADQKYYCGLYNPHNKFSCGSFVAEHMEAINAEIFGYKDLQFDLLKSSVYDSKAKWEAASDGGSYVVPVAGTDWQQKMQVCFDGFKKETVLAKDEYSFFRIDRAVTFESPRPLICGRPIYLRHHPKRKRLILNLLVDALSWGQMKKENFARVPEIVRFFQRGVIFNNNYSVSEYTYPSLATIETGLYPHRSQIFHPQRYARLLQRFRTTSEHMRRKGYYCAALMGESGGIYSGAYRGFDRIIANHFFKPSVLGVARAIEYLEAFKESDQFVNLHLDDVHPFPREFHMGLKTQVEMELEERFIAADHPSVILPASRLAASQYDSQLSMLNRQLSVLFDYIEEAYAEEDFVVNLYSDHGTSIFTPEIYFFSEEQCGSALMSRGGGVPQIGYVDDALTSCMDLHSILGKLADYAVDEAAVDSRLPKRLGGAGRDYVISNSIYPGQTYKLCIRTLAHEFRMESAAFTQEDGTVDLRRFSYQIYTRDAAHRRIESEALRRYFFQIADAHTASFRRD